MPTAPSAREYIVAGGGPSGLSAAHRLQAAGHRVRVLEAADRAGSKMCTEHRDGFVMDRAAIFVTTGYDRLLAVAGEVGSAAALVPGGSVFGLVRDRAIHEIDGLRPLRSLASTPYLSPVEKLMAGAVLAPEVWRARSVARERIADAGRYDTSTLGEWAARHLPAGLADYLVGAAIRSTYGAEADELSRVEFLGILALLGGGTLLGFDGGLQTHVDTLAATLDVTLGATVLEVLQRPGSAEVTWRDAHGAEHTDHADGCVVALPAQTARAVRADLDPWRAQRLAQVRQGEIVIVSVALDRPPPGVASTYTMLARGEHPDLAAIVCDHHKAPGRVPDGKGLLTLVVTSDWSRRHYGDDDADVASAVLRMVDGYLPGTADHALFTRVSRWHQQYPPVGHYAALGDLHQIARRLDRSVTLAGEYLYAPNLNASTASGEDAAAGLLATV